MNLHFAPITSKNQKQAEALSLFPEQIGFIESVSECLAEAEVVPEWVPLAIYDGAILVGFAMYGCFPQDREVWLDRLLIDKAHQGKGYGTAAVRSLLRLLFETFPCQEVLLSVYDVNRPAISLYKKTGFSFNGRLDTKGEKIMACPRSAVFSL